MIRLCILMIIMQALMSGPLILGLLTPNDNFE